MSLLNLPMPALKLKLSIQFRSGIPDLKYQELLLELAQEVGSGNLIRHALGSKNLLNCRNTATIEGSVFSMQPICMALIVM